MGDLSQASRCRSVAAQGLHTLINCTQHVLNLAQHDDNKLLLTNSNGTYVMHGRLNHHGQVSTVLNFSCLNQIASVTLVLCGCLCAYLQPHLNYNMQSGRACMIQVVQECCICLLLST